MSRLPEKTGKLSKAFCEGVITQQNGGTLGDLPYAQNGEEIKNTIAWVRGFRVSEDPTVWTISTAYSRGNLVTNGGNVYSCVSGGTSAGSGGPTGTAERIVDGTVVWQFQGAGTTVDLTCCGFTRAGEPAYKPMYSD
jgi:hypothetical protein